MNAHLKKMLYLGTRLSQVLGTPIIKSKNKGKPRKLVFYPTFQSKEELADQVNRVRWYVPESTRTEVWMAIENPLDCVDFNKLPVPAHQRAPSFAGDGIKLHLCRLQEIKTKLNIADVICVWNTKTSRWFRNILPHLLRVRIVDPDFYLSSECNSSAALLWYDLLTLAERVSWIDDSRLVLQRLFQELGGRKRAYLFGTGPSIKEVENHTYQDGVRIICNSMVRNDHLLELIQPHILGFTDSVFHFGVSKYAEAFAKDVIKVVRRYGVYCVTNQVGYALMRTHYPELTEYLIGVPARRFGRPIALSPTYLKTRDYTNILTRYMLPLAAGLSRELFLMGFDGRKSDENYFWKHNPTTQYTSSMDSAYKTHPAFFRDINYDAYYLKHCSTLSEMVKNFERNGIKIIVWGNSYIPALKKRCIKIQ